MTNILLDPLPTEVIIGGRGWPIRADHRTWIRFELLMQDEDLAPEEQIEQALKLCYPQLPDDLEGAVNGLLWFYQCGRENTHGDKKGTAGSGTARRRKAYCFRQDAALIYGAFMSAYLIDLTTEERLHWWEFRALFQALPSSCDFVKIMGYRTADLTGLSKSEKKHIEKMRKIYALENTRSASSTMELEQRNARMKAYIAKRYEEAMPH